MSKIGFGTGNFLVLGTEIKALPNTEQWVIRISCFAIGKDDKSFIELFEASFVDFWSKTCGELSICFSNGLFCGTAFDFEYLVVVKGIPIGNCGKVKAGFAAGDSPDEVGQHGTWI